jgi:hypothetical protein
MFKMLRSLCYFAFATPAFPLKARPRICTLFAHQRAALYHLDAVRSQIIALHLPMGAGKTRVALEFFAQRDNVAYIAPPALLPQVRAQIAEYLALEQQQCFTVSSTLPQHLPQYIVIDEYPTFIRSKIWTNLKRNLTPQNVILLLTGEQHSLQVLEKARSKLGESAVVSVQIPPHFLRAAQHHNIALQLSAAQAQKYASMRAESATAPSFALLQKHRKIVSAWKISSVVELLYQIESARCVVFSEFTATLLELAYTLNNARRKVYRFFGVDAPRRFEQLRAFLKSPLPSVLLCSVHVAARGLNLGSCEVLVLFEGVYDAENLRQTKARLTRVDQTSKPQHIYQFYFENTFEEKLVRSNTLQLEILSS